MDSALNTLPLPLREGETIPPPGEIPNADSPPAPIRHTCAFDEIGSESPAFLWEPYLRAGNLNLIAGDGGSGKTTLALMIAAALADGAAPKNMPGLLDAVPLEGTHSLILSFEDEPGELRHRLDLCLCRHPERIHTLKPGEIIPMLTDEAAMKALVEECRARLLVIDPVQAFLRNGADANSVTDVRRALDSLRRVCMETDCCGLLIAHLNKGAGRSAMHRVSGSMDFVNAVRSACLVVPHPKRKEERCMLHFKCNGAPLGDTVAFTFSEGGFVSFGGVSGVTREELENGYVSEPVETGTDKVRHLLERHTRRLPGWRMTAAELAGLPENTEGLSARAIAQCMMKAAHAAGIPVRRIGTGNVLVFQGGDQASPAAGGHPAP